MAANDVAAPLPQLDLLHGSIMTVELDDPGAQITALNVHGWQSDPDEPIEALAGHGRIHLRGRGSVNVRAGNRERDPGRPGVGALHPPASPQGPAPPAQRPDLVAQDAPA
jgi:hypothetical protein